MQLPHRLVVITPTSRTDEYDNPTPLLEYGPDAPRREVWGLMQPTGSHEPAEPGRQPVVSRWRLFSTAPLGARERILWRGLLFEVDGEPAAWSPRFGHVHYEATLSQVAG